MPRRTDRIRRIAWFWTLLILVVSWIPNQRLPSESINEFSLQIPHLDKWVHAGMFGVFGFLWLFSGSVSRGRVAMILSAGLGLALLTELGQGLDLVGRETSLGDGLADLAGLILAVGLGLAWKTFRGQAARVSQSQHSR